MTTETVQNRDRFVGSVRPLVTVSPEYGSGLKKVVCAGEHGTLVKS